ncbi:MAG: UDP-N-acetylmuramoyl-L-alanyl-D-glutamate--2,6-diaminopimelate ligase [Acidobacteriota bacterium]
MKLRTLLESLPAEWIAGVCGVDEDGPEIHHLAYDSRRVRPGSLFFAITGFQTDGNRYVPEAAAAGAVAVVSERAPAGGTDLPWIQVDRIRAAMSLLAARFYGEPARRLRLVGITGTNGKTTTAYLLHSIFAQEAPSLLLGTVEYIVGGRRHKSRLTTPESVDIQASLREAVDAGCRYGVMEVSSHSLALDRTYGCPIPVAVFTNLSQDHLDFHGTMEHYFAAKARLFDTAVNPGLLHAIVNGDDVWGGQLIRLAPRVVTYGLAPQNTFRAVDRRITAEGTRMRVVTPRGEFELESSLVGTHNVYNLLAAVAAADALGLPVETIRAGLLALQRVPGRFERVPVDRPFTVIIDYAHTPDALANVLKLARQVTAGRLICLFGCGGDRDRAKRPQMGAIAVRLADQVIVTSDNPRSEDPDAIIDDIFTGIPADAEHVARVTDRREAIRRALAMAEPGDLVLLAGKGHEDYQEISGQRYPFDERQVVQEVLCAV